MVFYATFVKASVVVAFLLVLSSVQLSNGEQSALDQQNLPLANGVNVATSSNSSGQPSGQSPLDQQNPPSVDGEKGDIVPLAPNTSSNSAEQPRNQSALGPQKPSSLGNGTDGVTLHTNKTITTSTTATIPTTVSTTTSTTPRTGSAYAASASFILVATSVIIRSF